ncbi:restriction endonuclease subunit S [Rossellomorea marisflavi]|uniref:restriction endonuclease subunit S n=1 Tax=Rossellomorea marisflavi TaxID=189381 RepID=UPI003D2EA39C
MQFNKFQNKNILINAKKNGWSLSSFNELFKDDTKFARKIKKENYLLSGKNPVIDQGKSLIGGYTDEDLGLYEESPYIIFGDHTRILKYVNFPSFIGADGVKLIKNIHSDEDIQTKYLYFFLKTIEIPNTGYNRHFKYFKEIVIPIPSINIQLKIVETLEKTLLLIEKRRKQLTLLSSLRQSLFLEMFGNPFVNNRKWKVQSLGNIATIIMGQSPPGASYNTLGNGLPLLNGPAEFTDKHPIEKQWTTDPKKVSEKGDILFCVRGATAGRMNISNKTYAIGRGLASIRVTNNSDLHFVYLTLKFMYSHFQNTSNGSTFINIDKKTLDSIPIFIVENSFKEKYFKISQEIEKQEILLNNSLRMLKTKYSTLSQRAFNGELFNK